MATTPAIQSMLAAVEKFGEGLITEREFVGLIADHVNETWVSSPEGSADIKAFADFLYSRITTGRDLR